MEIVALVASFLSPFMPHLLKLGQPVAEGAGKKLGEKLGEGSWEKAKKLWGKLGPKVEEKSPAKEAATDTAKCPDDKDYQAALRVQFKKILAEDEGLMEALKSILEENTPDGASGLQIVQRVTGNQNQVIGQVTGGQVFGNVQGNVTMNTGEKDV